MMNQVGLERKLPSSFIVDFIGLVQTTDIRLAIGYPTWSSAGFGW
jgi:hypothetical protein